MPQTMTVIPLLSFALLILSLLLPTTANPITIPPPPYLPPVQPSPHNSHPNIVHHNLLARATYELPGGYTVHFTTTLSLLPVQMAAISLELWYRALLRALAQPRENPQTNIQTSPYNRPFGFHTTYIQLSFQPQAPNLASRAMVMAFVEWLEERAARGFVEFFEAVIEGPWGSVGAKMGLIDGVQLGTLLGDGGGGVAVGRVDYGEGGSGSGSGSGSETVE